MIFSFIISYSLHLTFDNNKSISTIYTEKDVIKKSVHLEVIQSISTTSIAIHLKCKARTIIERSNDQNSYSHQSTVVVYNTTKQLMNESFIFIINFDWSFEFKLSSLTQQMTSRWASSKIFKHIPDHSLSSSWVFEDKSQCIEHFLEIVMQRSFIDINAIHRFSVKFFFSRNVLLSHTESMSKQQFISRRSYLLEQVSHSKRSDMPKLVSSLFNIKNSDLVAGFNLSSTLSIVFYVDESLSITLSLIYDSVRSTAREISPVYIINLFARVIIIIDVRVDYNSLMSSDEYHHDFRGKITLCWLSQIRVLMSENMKLHKLLSTLRIDQKLCLSFKIYNIECSYILKISISNLTLFRNLHCNFAT